MTMPTLSLSAAPGGSIAFLKRERLGFRNCKASTINFRVPEARKFRCTATAAANNSDSPPSSSSSPLLNRAGYHPLEELTSLEKEELEKANGGPQLTPGEKSRTILQANSTGILLTSASASNSKYFATEVPYLVDEHGQIYFELSDDSDILHKLFVSPICSFMVGFKDLDDVSSTLQLFQNRLNLSGNDEEDEEDEEDDEDDEEDDDDDDDDDVDDEEDDEDDSDEDDNVEGGYVEDDLNAFGDCATLSDVHPMNFSARLAEAASCDVLEKICSVSMRVAMTGTLESVGEEEEAYVRRIWDNKFLWDEESDEEEEDDDDDDDDDVGVEEGIQEEVDAANSSDYDDENIVVVDDDDDEEEDDEDDDDNDDDDDDAGSRFYKFDILGIQIVSDTGNNISVGTKEFVNSEPDVVADAATLIINRLNNGGGKKLRRALKSLCQRDKSLTVEDAAIVGVDSLGVDVRVSWGIELRTIRFPFTRRARCAESAHLLLHEILYPRQRHKK